MSARTYPYKAWALTPSFKPVEIELVSNYGMHHDETAKGKIYNAYHELYPTKAAAIAAGRKKIDEQQAETAKRLERINKRIAALDKAELEA